MLRKICVFVNEHHILVQLYPFSFPREDMEMEGYLL